MNTKITKEKYSAKNDIVKVAMKMFAQKGYHKTSTAAISKELNISTGLLFYHFGSKKKLLDAIVDQILFKLNYILEGTNCGSPKAEIECIIDRLVYSVKEDTSFWDLYLALLYQPDTKNLLLERVILNSKKFRRKIYELLKEMGSKDPSTESFAFEIFRVGIFTSYISTHNEAVLAKSISILKSKFIY